MGNVIPPPGGNKDTERQANVDQVDGAYGRFQYFFHGTMPNYHRRMHAITSAWATKYNLVP